MFKIYDILAHDEFQVVNGGDFLKSYYGDNMWIIDTKNLNCVFDRLSLDVREIVINLGKSGVYRWIDPSYRNAVIDDNILNGIDFNIFIDDIEFTDIPTDEVLNVLKNIKTPDYKYTGDVIIDLNFDAASMKLIKNAADLEGISTEEFIRKALINQFDVQETTS